MDNEEHNSNYSWVIFILIFISSWFIFSGDNKYEGQTAEDWYNEYDAMEIQSQNLKECIDTLKSQLEDIGDESLWAEDSDYNEMNDTLFSIRLNSDPECDY